MAQKLIPLVMACVVLLAHPLGAQEGLWQRVRQAYDAEAVARIQAMVAEAGAASVPAEPLLEKALEGSAKGVPAARVLPALQEYAGRLGQVVRLLPPRSSRAGMVAGAEALRRGVPPEAVGRMAREHPEAAATSLVVLGDLVEAGVPVEQAQEAVREAMARGHGPHELLDLPAVVRRRMREGHGAAEAARGAAGAMGKGGPPPGVGGGPPGGPPGKPPVPPGAKGAKGKPGGPGGKPGGG